MTDPIARVTPHHTTGEVLSAVWMGVLAAAVGLGVWIGALTSLSPQLRAGLLPHPDPLTVLVVAVTALMAALILAVTGAVGPFSASAAELMLTGGPRRRAATLGILAGVLLMLSAALASGLITALGPLLPGPLLPAITGILATASLLVPPLLARAQRSRLLPAVRTLPAALVAGAVTLLVAFRFSGTVGASLITAAGVAAIVLAGAVVRSRARAGSFELIPRWELLRADGVVTAAGSAAVSMDVGAVRTHGELTRPAARRRALAPGTMRRLHPSARLFVTVLARAVRRTAATSGIAVLVAISATAFTPAAGTLAIGAVAALLTALRLTSILGDLVVAVPLRSVFAAAAPGAAWLTFAALAVTALVPFAGAVVVHLAQGGQPWPVLVFAAVAAAAVTHGLVGPTRALSDQVNGVLTTINSPELGPVPIYLIQRVTAGWVAPLALLGAALLGLDAVALIAGAIAAVIALTLFADVLKKNQH